MGHKFAEIAFTKSVKQVQAEMGSRKAMAHRESGEDTNDRIGPAESAFIAERDSFYMATVSETGWPYVQHRGGPPGFVRTLDDKSIGFADFTGNRQYVSVGNLAGDNRVSLFFMDYLNRRRLKLFGHARVVGGVERDILDKLMVPDYRARVERGLVITVDAFDWNCPQHITERFTFADVDAVTKKMQERIVALEAEITALKQETMPPA